MCEVINGLQHLAVDNSRSYRLCDVLVLNSKYDEEKIALLNNVGGAGLKDIYNGLTWAGPTEDVSDESKVYARVTLKMDTYFNVKKNQLSARRTFSTMIQRSTKSLEQFITRIRTTVKSCDFGNEEISLFWDIQMMHCVRNSTGRNMKI